MNKCEKKNGTTKKLNNIISNICITSINTNTICFVS